MNRMNLKLNRIDYINIQFKFEYSKSPEHQKVGLLFYKVFYFLITFFFVMGSQDNFFGRYDFSFL